MKKPYRLLIAFISTCLCFLIVTLTGTPVFPLGEQEENTESSETSSFFSANDENSDKKPEWTSDNNKEPEDAESDLQLMQISPAPEAVPTPLPTSAPTTAPTPTPTTAPTPSPTPAPTPAPEPFDIDFVLADVAKTLNIRSGPGTDHSIIGKISTDGYMKLLERGAEWTKISTGNIKEGYVSTQYLLMDEDAAKECEALNAVSLIVTTDSLNVRSGPGTEFEKLALIKRDESYPVFLTKSCKDWIAMELSDGAIGYVSSKYIRLNYDFKTGMTLEEIKERERQAAIEEAMRRARIYSVEETTREAKHVLTEEEYYLFATVITTEANDQPYEGMLAVANVILNRMEDGYWGNTLEEVLYAPGQFAGAKQHLVERAQARGIPDRAYRAADEALAGRNNIGDFKFFCADYVAEYTKYDVFYVMHTHVFYKRSW